jgi:hypothetical protein
MVEVYSPRGAGVRPGGVVPSNPPTFAKAGDRVPGDEPMTVTRLILLVMAVFLVITVLRLLRGTR